MTRNDDISVEKPGLHYRVGVGGLGTGTMLFLLRMGVVFRTFKRSWASSFVIPSQAPLFTYGSLICSGESIFRDGKIKWVLGISRGGWCLPPNDIHDKEKSASGMTHTAIQNGMGRRLGHGLGFYGTWFFTGTRKRNWRPSTSLKMRCSNSARGRQTPWQGYGHILDKKDEEIRSYPYVRYQTSL
jgi:hypothetical protein